ncbi:MAG: hypothetical protein M3179_15110 [Actinomycetota bacterium]|nr:hypothetical protein [Actinomycetota bacterium]
MDTSCTCGCGAMTTVTQAQEPCGCGCECCGDAVTVKSKEQEVAELTSLREAIDSRLQELGV